MSSGGFIRTKYESNAGTIHPIRLQPETVAAYENEAPTGAINSPISAVVSLTRRQRGLRPRYISVVLTAAKPDYKAGTIYKIPILSATKFAEIEVGEAGTYLGVAAEVVGKEDERVR